MSEKKPEDEFDWTQALADWATTTFAPEAAERKRSAPPTKSPDPPASGAPRPPLPTIAPDDERTATGAELEDRAEPEIPAPAPSTRTLYKPSGPLSTPKPAPVPRMVPVDAPPGSFTREPVSPPLPVSDGAPRWTAPLPSATDLAFNLEDALAENQREADARSFAEARASLAEQSTEAPAEDAETRERLAVTAMPPPGDVDGGAGNPTPLFPGDIAALEGQDLVRDQSHVRDDEIDALDALMASDLDSTASSPAASFSPPPLFGSRASSEERAVTRAPAPAAPAGDAQRASLKPLAASISLRPTSADPGAPSALGDVLGSEPSDDELDALLSGFVDEDDEASRRIHARRSAAEPSTRRRADEPPTPLAFSPTPLPVPVSPQLARGAGIPASQPNVAFSSSDEPVDSSLAVTAQRPAVPRPPASRPKPSQATQQPEPPRFRPSPAWPLDEEEPTAVRDFPNAELSALLAAERSSGTSSGPGPSSAALTRPPPPGATPYEGRPVDDEAKTTDASSRGTHLRTPPPPATRVTPAPPATASTAPTRVPALPSRHDPALTDDEDRVEESVTGLHIALSQSDDEVLEKDATRRSDSSAPRDPAHSEVEMSVSSSMLDMSEIEALENLSMTDAEDTRQSMRGSTGHAPARAEVTTTEFVDGESSTSDWGTERVASQWLQGPSRESFVARAEWFEAEARLLADPTARGRLLLLASELRAMLGDPSAAASLAREARDLAPQIALAHRQLRGITGSGDGPTFLDNLDHSLRAASLPSVKMHDTLLAADCLRIGGDDDGARRRYEQAARIGVDDLRLAVGRAGLALARGETASVALRIPDAATGALGALARAADAALRLRGAEARASTVDPSLTESLRRARSALEKNALSRASSALEGLGRDDSLVGAVRWLVAALLGVAPESKDDTRHGLDALRSLDDPRARRWIAARGLETDDPTIVSEALADRDAFSAPEQLVLLLLSGAGADRVRVVTGQVAEVPEMAPLTSAAAGLRSPLDGHLAGEETSRHEVHLARLLSADAAPHAVASAIEALAGERPHEMLALHLDAARAAGRFGDIADALGSWGGEAPARETTLAAALVAERGGDESRAREAYRRVAEEDPSSLLALRALGALDNQRDERAALRARASALGTGIEAAVAEIELFARLGATVEGLEALERATHAAPTFAVPYLLLERASRQRGDLVRVVQSLKSRRELMTDPLEMALDGVREALLVADTEPEHAAEILLAAHLARPDDVALRELYERLTTVSPHDRAAWRERRAKAAPVTTQKLWLLESAHLYALSGDQVAALRVATELAGAAPEGLARLALEDAELSTGQVSRLQEELMARAKAATDGVDRRETYERLAEVDAARGDMSGALLWHRSALEESPEHLSSLRYIEDVLVGEAREDELEPLAAAVAKKLAPSGDAEGVAHAAMAAWLRARAGEHDQVEEMAALARRTSPAPLWALRAWNAHARIASESTSEYDSIVALLERSTRPHEQATLAMRLGDAATRLGRQADAASAYARATSLDAGDVSAWEKLADAQLATGNSAAAAEALEAAARTSRVEAHRLLAWYRAGLAWSDKVLDEARARAALEQAAQLDLSYQDTFTRLSALYAKAGARMELASLLERRANDGVDDQERVKLEVERGRILVEVGEPTRARAALEAALALEPDHPIALDLVADLSAAAGDFGAAEQAWVRLARLVPSTEEQRAIYTKLGVLYADHLGNLSRAELAFREVIKRAPGDVATLERLVAIYSKQNDAARALEMQSELVAKATNPGERRDRMIELSRMYETTARDPRKAEQTLDNARRELPQDVVLLRGLAEFYTRHRQMPAVNMLLDRTASDVRRALAQGRFLPAAFEIMTAVYELRGNRDAAQLIGASLAAIEGRPSDLKGGEGRAGDTALDDLLAPELISSALRTLLARSGEALDALAPVDLKSLRATPLPPNHPLVVQANTTASRMGVSGVQVHVAPQLGMMCVPVSTSPPVVVLGESLVQSPLARARNFLLFRALKLVQARCGALVRIPPKDAPAAIGGYFRVFNPSWEPPGVPAQVVMDAMRRLQTAMPRHSDPDGGLLALEAAQSLFQQPQAVSPSLLSWANRAALLSVGDPNAALDAMAWSNGLAAGAPQGEARSAFIARTPEARELLIFSLSDAYAEARKRCGLSGGSSK